MSLEEQLKEINDMGITICNKTYKFKSFSPNKFAEYVSKNSNLIYRRALKNLMFFKCGYPQSKK